MALRLLYTMVRGEGRGEDVSMTCPQYISFAPNSTSLVSCPSPTGSRTPSYGYMTPDPSRTPLHGGGGAWDPSVANTPFHEQEYDTPSPASVSGHTRWG